MSSMIETPAAIDPLMEGTPTAAAASPITKAVRFSDEIACLPPDVDESDQDEQARWFTEADIASFREDTIRTVQAWNDAGGRESDLDDEQYCLRGLEKKMVKRPPPNFIRNVLRLQDHQRRKQKSGDDLATSLQLFSIACSKWARKRAIQLASEDEYDAYQIFMAGLRQQQISRYDNVDDDDDDDGDDDDYDMDEDDDFFGDDDEFDFCTESHYVHSVYDCVKHEPTEDETEYEDYEDFDGDDEDLLACIGSAVRSKS